MCISERALAVAKEAATLAGAEIRAAHLGRAERGLAVIVKTGIDLVTETDQKCEKIILKLLQDAFPDHRFVGEESTFAAGDAESVRGPCIAVRAARMAHLSFASLDRSHCVGSRAVPLSFALSCPFLGVSWNVIALLSRMRAYRCVPNSCMACRSSSFL